VELHGQHNSQNCEERNVERWVPSISQRIRATKVKRGVKLRRKSRTAIDIAFHGTLSPFWHTDISEFEES
jgi:hypothetical protein